MKRRGPRMNGPGVFIESASQARSSPRGGPTTRPGNTLGSHQDGLEPPQFSYQDPSTAGKRGTHGAPYYVRSRYEKQVESSQDDNSSSCEAQTLDTTEVGADIGFEVTQNPISSSFLSEQDGSIGTQPAEINRQVVREAYLPDDDVYDVSTVGHYQTPPQTRRSGRINDRTNELHYHSEPSKTLQGTGFTGDASGQEKRVNSSNGSESVEHSTKEKSVSKDTYSTGEMTTTSRSSTTSGSTSTNGTTTTSGSTNTPSGQGPGVVSFHYRKMWYCEKNKSGAVLQEAVYHKDIRAQLIATAATNGVYDFPRQSGLATDDVTSYLAAQKSWNVEHRNHRPDILFQWEKKGHANPAYIVPDWYHDGRIVLDPNNRPVRRFHNIPDACSSLLEGGIMEAIKREDRRINHQDFIARMLPEIIVQTSKGRQTQPLYGKNAMAARMRRFREEAGCIVWGARAGSDKIRNYMQGLMPHQCIADNSTRDFRDLYPHEVMAIRQQNEGRFAERAGDRAIDDDEREARKAKMRAKFERRKERFEEGLKRNKPNTEKKRRRTATKRNGTEDEAEVSAFTVDGEASASTKEERRRDLGNMLGGSSKRKRSEIAWDEESFELRDDGDDEGLQLYDEGCFNPNASRQKRQTKRLKLTGAGDRNPSSPQILQGQNISLLSGHASQSLASAVPFADANVANLEDSLDSNGQVPRNVDVCQFGSIDVDTTSDLGVSAINAVSSPFEVDFSNVSAFTEGQSSFYAALYSEPTATYRFGPSDVTSEHGDFVGSTFAPETVNFDDAGIDEQAAAYNVGSLNGPLSNDEVVDHTITAETSKICDASRGESAAASHVDPPNAAAASNDIHEFDQIFAEYTALTQSNTNAPDIEWGTSLDRFFGDNVVGKEVHEDQDLFSGVYLLPYESGDQVHPP